MKSVIVCTAGHIDHGKSALVQAVTGTDPDRLKEEKARGITIDLGFAHTTIDGLNVAFVDVPGHERFVKNMLAGVGGIDLVVMVVAADESVMPQTREHFEICRLLQVPAGIVVLTKADLVDADTLELARIEIRELAAGSFLDGAPMVAVSARTGQGLDELRASLVAAGAFVRPRTADAALEVIVAAKPIKRGARVRFHQGTSEILGRVALIGPRREAPPGSREYVRLRLQRPAGLVRGDRFLIRTYSPPRTIAGGRILDPAPPRMAISRESAVERCR